MQVVAWALAAALLVGVGFWAGRATQVRSAAIPRTVTGWATASEDLRAVALFPTQDRASSQGSSYDISSASWSDGSDSWHSAGTVPPCVSAGPAGPPARVELGVVTAEATGSMPGAETVVWLRCLSS